MDLLDFPFSDGYIIIYKDMQEEREREGRGGERREVSGAGLRERGKG